MFHFMRWNSQTTQICFEKAAFIFISNLPVAFKRRNEKAYYFNEAVLQPDTSAADCRERIQLMGYKTETMPMHKFNENVTKAYQQALLSGAAELGKKLIQPKEQQNVTDDQSGPCTIDYRNHR